MQFNYNFLIIICIASFAILSFVALKVSGVLTTIAKSDSGSKSEQAILWHIYMQLVHNAVNPMLAVDIDGFVLAWNKRAEFKFGWSQAEVFKKEFAELIIPIEFREGFRDVLKLYKETGKSTIIGSKEGIEFEVTKKNGEKIPIRLYLSELDKEKDRFVNIGVVVVDITKEKEREKVFKEEISFLIQGEKDAGIGTWSWDLLGKDVEVSDNFCNIFNVEKEDGITADKLLELVYHEDRTRTVKIINEAVKNNKSQGYEVNYRRLMADGSLTKIHCKAFFVYDEDGVKRIHGSIQKLDEVHHNPVVKKTTRKRTQKKGATNK